MTRRTRESGDFYDDWILRQKSPFFLYVSFRVVCFWIVLYFTPGTDLITCYLPFFLCHRWQSGPGPDIDVVKLKCQLRLIRFLSFRMVCTSLRFTSLLVTIIVPIFDILPFFINKFISIHITLSTGRHLCHWRVSR